MTIGKAAVFVLSHVLGLAAVPVAAFAVEPQAPEKLISRPDAVRSFILERLQSKGRNGVALSKQDRDALTAYYRAGDSLIWVDGGGYNTRVARVRTAFARAAEWGLDANAYFIPNEPKPGPNEAYPAALIANAELAMSTMAYSYASHAQAGRIEPSSLGESIDVSPERPAIVSVLDGLRQATGNEAEFLESFHPPHPQFNALKQKLAEIRKPLEEAVHPIIPDGPNLSPGMTHPSVAMLRKRLNVAALANERGERLDDVYDDALADAVRKFQRENGLAGDAQVGPVTRNILNGGAPRVDARSLLVNMERWRWLPRHLGKDHVRINIPEYMFRVIKNNVQVHEERIVVGKPQHMTPVFHDEMEFVVLNPVWNVPASIAVKEILPLVRRNPAYLDRNNLQVFVRGRRLPLDPYGVDWDYVNPEKLYIKQPPGDDNALGRVKFLFPNKHSVYMHDTPTKHLFSQTARAYSHGCMRVRNPLRFAEVLLQDQGWTMQRINAVLSRRGEYSITLDRKIPIFVSYFTVWVNDDGSLKTFRDIYGHDQRLRLGLAL